MDKLDQLRIFMDNTISGDTEAANTAFVAYAQEKAKEVIAAYQNRSSVNESFYAQLLEFTGDSAIKMRGDDVIINGKTVGSIRSDLEDIDGGINYVEAGGNFSKEFNSAEELYAFLIKRYGVKD